MPKISDYNWVRTVMKEVIGDDTEFRVRASGTTTEGPELEMGVYLGDQVERLPLCGPGWDLDDRPDKEAYVREWTAKAMAKLRTK